MLVLRKHMLYNVISNQFSFNIHHYLSITNMITCIRMLDKWMWIIVTTMFHRSYKINYSISPYLQRLFMHCYWIENQTFIAPYSQHTGMSSINWCYRVKIKVIIFWKINSLSIWLKSRLFVCENFDYIDWW